ncbi:MAG TPA: hypothetical protein VE173_12270, partial [Longimicrobiales bacterium]|nr:hypothetical protein [Longimicrobiales bacterium]
AEPLDRIIGAFTGETEAQSLFARGRGGGGFGRGGGARDPEAFVERPGESFGGGGRGGGGRGGAFGGIDTDQLREVAELVNPGGGMRGLFGRGRGGRGGFGGGGELVEPGSYTVTLKVGDRTFTRAMEVHRMPGMESSSDSPEAIEREEAWRRLLEGEGGR